MNARITASLALKLIGIFVLVRYLEFLPWMLGPLGLLGSIDLSWPEIVGMIAFSLGTPLLYLVVCLFVILKSDTIARRIVPDEQAAISVDVDADTIQKLAFSVVGLVLLTSAIPKLAELGSNHVMLKHFDPFATLTRHQYASLIATIVQAAIGVALFLQVDGLARIWKKLRGTEEMEPDSGDSDVGEATGNHKCEA